jgi:hypothetical protein
MEEKKITRNTRKEVPPKNKPVRIIVEPVYIGDKKISEVFFDVIYSYLLSKSTQSA